MKDLNVTIETEKGLSLVEEVMNSKPEFASREEALKAYTERLETFAKKCGRSIPDLLNTAENSPEPDDDAEEAMELWGILSLLKRKL